MELNLNCDSTSFEIAKIDISVKNSQNADFVEILFNKEAMVGFAKNLIWIYEDIDKNKSLYVCTDPLGGVPSGNQVVGFYLTEHSPTFVFRINSLRSTSKMKCFDNIIHPKLQTEKYIEVLPPLDDSVLEDYEIGFKNIARIDIYKNNVNISKKIHEIIFEINYEGLKQLAIIMFKLVENYSVGKEYVFSQLLNNNIMDSEIVLTPDSLPVKFKCANLGSVYDYEPNFGSLL